MVKLTGEVTSRQNEDVSGPCDTKPYAWTAGRFLIALKSDSRTGSAPALVPNPFKGFLERFYQIRTLGSDQYDDVPNGCGRN